MPITREKEQISPEVALDVLATSNRSPTATATAELNQATVAVLESVPDVPAFITDIILVNGYIVDGHEELSAIANGGKVVTAWVSRSTTLRQVDGS